MVLQCVAVGHSAQWRGGWAGLLPPAMLPMHPCTALCPTRRALRHLVASGESVYNFSPTPCQAYHHIFGQKPHPVNGPLRQRARHHVPHSTNNGLAVPGILNAAFSPDAEIMLPNGSVVRLFGVQHCVQQPHIAEHILRTRPAAVVVETALSTLHGAAAGTALSADDPGTAQQMQSDFYARMFYQLGGKLKDEPEPWTSSTWQTVAAQFGGEQLTYIAAFATGAALVFGDRPKADTFARLASLPSLCELDAAFGQQSALNYREQLTGRPASSDWSAAPGEREDVVERIMLRERDHVLAHSLRDAALAAGPGAIVVGVIGEAHLPGVRYLMHGAHWLSAEELLEVCTAPPAAAVGGGSAGVRRALVEAAVRLRCRSEVCAALDAALPPVPVGQQQQYELTTELYGTCRMMLASLSAAQLTEVASGWRCDFHQVLEPVRAARPVNGGGGYDEELLQSLRLLHFQVQDEVS